MLLNKQWITEEIKEEIKKYLQIDDNENTMTQNKRDGMGCSKSSSKREIYGMQQRQF